MQDRGRTTGSGLVTLQGLHGLVRPMTHEQQMNASSAPVAELRA